MLGDHLRTCLRWWKVWVALCVHVPQWGAHGVFSALPTIICKQASFASSYGLDPTFPNLVHFGSALAVSNSPQFSANRCPVLLKSRSRWGVLWRKRVEDEVVFQAWVTALSAWSSMLRNQIYNCFLSKKQNHLQAEAHTCEGVRLVAKDWDEALSGTVCCSERSDSPLAQLLLLQWHSHFVAHNGGKYSEPMV